MISVLYNMICLTLYLILPDCAELVFLGGFHVINANPLISIWCTWLVRVNSCQTGKHTRN